jgi:hypothetical protein
MRKYLYTRFQQFSYTCDANFPSNVALLLRIQGLSNSGKKVSSPNKEVGGYSKSLNNQSSAIC